MPVPDATGPAARNAAIRTAARAARASLSDRRRRSAQEEIVRRLLSLAEIGDGSRVGWYLPTDGEVDLHDAVATLRSRGVVLHLPVVGPERSLRFAPWHPGAPMRHNRYGIDEPAVAADQSVGADELDVVVVPCVAVDPRGRRLGFGAGYYDRALCDSTATLVGVVFREQVVEHLDAAPWDVPLHLVVTDDGVLGPDAHDPG